MIKTEPAASSKLLTLEEMSSLRDCLWGMNKRLVLVNGCFDLLHTGHVDFLSYAKKQGQVLLVLLISDTSIRKTKGSGHPVNSEQDRAKVLSALADVDYIMIANAEEVEGIVKLLIPDIVVRGKDWSNCPQSRAFIEGTGGRVVAAPVFDGRSSTKIIEQIQAQGRG